MINEIYRHIPPDFALLPEQLRFVVEHLNAALLAHRTAVSQLFSKRIDIAAGASGETALDPFFILMDSQDKGWCELGPLGMLNGVLTKMGYEKYRVFRQGDERTDEIEFFGVIQLS